MDTPSTPTSPLHSLFPAPGDHLWYNIATALRGPDHQWEDVYSAMTAKNMTTAVIRSLVGIPEPKLLEVRPNVTSPSTAILYWESLVEESRVTTRAYFKKNWHFSSHLKTAFAALRILNVPGAGEYYKWFSANVIEL